ncbi:family 2A encapsulin nanocompartment cargo protein cysteine desulfurase [Piscinibacter sp. XHJ-5]|uniref:family 2A encapsulin nanocompartment cargo protein cysteine desulfurase n=1 Tax=Piscinibacter sp. XHJ-5 TaxID=3037797 RepID=UPI002452E0C2|nr:family 2A encapsulin nanocompartment cargo protein cysteine desulfurase [Piscinibacter sp. XHJ-5]
MPTPDLLNPAPPTGLPDPAVLARLAGDFFAAMPGSPGIAAAGGVPLPANPQPPGMSPPPGALGPSTPSAVPVGALPPGANLLPQSPQTAANGFASAPSLWPHAVAPNGVPDLLLGAAPGYDGRLGSHALAARHPASAPSFYFLSEASAAHTGEGPRYSVERAAAQPPFDLQAIRRDFPILRERVNGRPLVWFDNAATTQKPQAVIDRLSRFYSHENSNIHRAAHELAARATDAYEGARESVRRFINARAVEEIVFVRGTTEAINLVAKSWGAQNIREGDEIVVSHLEHHANIVPWQQLCAEKGATLRVIPVDDSGQVRLDEYQRLLSERTKLVAVTQVSNALGTVVPVKEIVALAHRAGAKALVDGAQSVSHMRVDVQSLDADFFVFSGHKIFGPTGIGALYGKRAILEEMPPWQGGGNMIADVTFERTAYHGAPARFEAGTGNIADAVGLGAALEYVERIGIEAIGQYEHALLDYATQRMTPIAGLRLVGTARDKASVLSFVLEGHATDEVGRALNEEGIAVRTGHHCAQPILRRFGLETTVRPSLAFYNTCEEVDRMVAVVSALARSRR